MDPRLDHKCPAFRGNGYQRLWNFRLALPNTLLVMLNSKHENQKILIVTFSLRLVTYLYSERLLNQDQYLQWITSSLQTCDFDSIWVWLHVAQIYWKEILRYRQRGKYLAEAVLIQLSKVESLQETSYSMMFIPGLRLPNWPPPRPSHHYPKPLLGCSLPS